MAIAKPLPRDILELIGKTTKLPPDREEEIEKFLEPLITGKFGDSVEWQWKFRDFPIWVIGKIIKYQRERRKKARFEGDIKLHKIAYFMKHYKFKNLGEFYYDPMYFGPYSEQLNLDLNNLIADEYIKKSRENHQNTNC